MKFRLVEEQQNIEYDSEGNALTPEQSEFFRNSKIRDEQGRLLVCYHGGNAKISSFMVNTGATFFSACKDYSSAYARKKDFLHTVYLNITNPFDTRNKEHMDIFQNQIVPYINKKGWQYPTPIEEYRVNNGKLSFVWVDLVYPYIRHYTNFDGMIVGEFSSGEYDNNLFNDVSETSFVPVKPNQIKLITNTNPTSSNNINESLRVIHDENLLDRYECDKIYEDDDNIYIFYDKKYVDKNMTDNRMQNADDLLTLKKIKYQVKRTDKGVRYIVPKRQ